jgi:DNA-binding transcriptional LysR family regulator
VHGTSFLFRVPTNIRLDADLDNQDKTGSGDDRIGTVMEAGLKGLEAVLAIARRGSFRAAALDLGMSTTALSHTIARLEAVLGVRLFNRTTRSVSLTDAGRDFVERIAPAIAEIRGAMESVQSQRRTPSGLLRINALVQGGREIAPLVLAFLRRFPQMQVDLVTEGRLVDIVA